MVIALIGASFWDWLLPLLIGIFTFILGLLTMFVVLWFFGPEDYKVWMRIRRNKKLVPILMLEDSGSSYLTAGIATLEKGEIKIGKEDWAYTPTTRDAFIKPLLPDDHGIKVDMSEEEVTKQILYNAEYNKQVNLYNLNIREITPLNEMIRRQRPLKSIGRPLLIGLASRGLVVNPDAAFMMQASSPSTPAKERDTLKQRGISLLNPDIIREYLTTDFGVKRITNLKRTAEVTGYLKARKMEGGEGGFGNLLPLLLLGVGLMVILYLVQSGALKGIGL
jgi:hypothetical protein